MKFTYCNTDTKAVSKDIGVLFPGFGENEVLAVMSPHDDDAILGAGYAMLAAQQAGAEVYVVIFCRGDAGYSTVAEKASIEEVRTRETFDCYARLGVPADHILRAHRLGKGGRKAGRYAADAALFAREKGHARDDP